jgi:aminoglycoside phosphotransferase (APT) family kinase protein
VPTFDVLALDITMREWPWEYLIVTQLPGQTWQSLYPRLDPDSRSLALRQIADAAAQLHTLPFDAFGELRPDGSMVDGCSTATDALRGRIWRRLGTDRYRECMLKVLDAHADAFATAPGPTLCHEDLNPNNLLFETVDSRPVLSGVLDFETAWAGLGESDLARLELWRFTGGPALRAGYAERVSLGADYLRRRPVLQLLWCLEYAESGVSPRHQADTERVCQELGVPPSELSSVPPDGTHRAAADLRWRI